jgi:hypothetical protein
MLITVHLEVGNVTSKCNGVTSYRFTFRRDNGMNFDRAIIFRRDNAPKGE